MNRVIISDTSCFIVLSKIGELELLEKLYKEILTTEDIALEFGEPLPNWVRIENVKDLVKQQILEIQIDKGESSAIALAVEMPNSVLIIDDNKARKIANSLNLHCIGTIGVIIRAKLEGHIDSIKPLLNKIKSTNFRLSYELEKQAIVLARED